jgi:hypothetical protein
MGRLHAVKCLKAGVGARWLAFAHATAQYFSQQLILMTGVA